MAGNQEQTSKGSGQETIFNSGIGDDWGEAFEAEDFMAAPSDESSTEFFLPDEAIPDAALSLAAAEAESADPDGETAEQQAGFLPSILARFQALPTPLRYAVGILPFVVVPSLYVALRGKPPEQVAPVASETPKVVMDSPAGTEAPATPAATPEGIKGAAESHPAAPVVPPPEQHANVDAHGPAAHGEQAVVAEEPKELRKKWRFPALIVPAKTNKEQGAVVLSVDLTLTLYLPPEIMPPSDKESFVRELLYQFYTNQPVEDLQRYAIDRGDMNRKLQAWIVKQWPDLKLAGIAIDRYQLL